MDAVLNDNRISEALEDYLETIYIFSLKKSSVRITDISLCLGISKPSVNRAVNTLKNKGLVSHEPYGDIILTESGRERGKLLYERRKLIEKFLTDVLKLTRDDAEKEACQLEHNISDSTVDKMADFMKA